MAARTASLPAPVGGWNARDSLADMDETDAVTLENWFPRLTSVRVRPGYASHATGLPSTVESLLPWRGATAQKLFAASGTVIHDATSAGAVGSAVVSSLTNARWESVNLSIGGTSYLYAVNGADEPLLYNGSTWVAIDGSSTPSVTGVTTTTLSHINVFKRRVFFVEKDSMSVWYLPVDSVGGAASEIDFGPLFKKGGYLLAMATWSLDAGEGADDHAVFLTSEGEVAVYKGTDPSSAAAWGLIGVFQISRPIGKRCFVQFGGDLAVITEDGFYPLSAALITGQLNPLTAISNKIANAVYEASQYKANHGWEGFFYSPESMLVFNVPTSTTTAEQYVMNTVTQSWCRFTGIPAICWAEINGQAYFGGDEVVYSGLTGESDNGGNIVANVQQAYSYFGQEGRNKSFRMARPTFVATGEPAVAIDVDVDYTQAEPTSLVTLGAVQTAGVWDTAVWDTGIWGGGTGSSRIDWQTVGGVGIAGSVQMKTAARNFKLEWISTDLIYEVGGPL